jgi:hypothetical protein
MKLVPSVISEPEAVAIGQTVNSKNLTRLLSGIVDSKVDSKPQVATTPVLRPLLSIRPVATASGSDEALQSFQVAQQIAKRQTQMSTD